MLPLFQSPLSISTEISSISKRAFVIGLGCVTWALGNMALPLVGWAIARYIRTKHYMDQFVVDFLYYQLKITK